MQLASHRNAVAWQHLDAAYPVLLMRSGTLKKAFRHSTKHTLFCTTDTRCILMSCNVSAPTLYVTEGYSLFIES